ncbi:MAG: hypothetical protein UCH28_12110, partial [Adlercreutzia sp.]|nr:hypothetical protein [Adlercreutzia sp.]
MKNKEPKETVTSNAGGDVPLSLGSSGEVSETAAPGANGRRAENGCSVDALAPAASAANTDGVGAASRVVHT